MTGGDQSWTRNVLISTVIVITLIITSGYMLWNPEIWHINRDIPYFYRTSQGSPPTSQLPKNASSINASLHAPKPTGLKIVGFVFYGRPKYVNILDCYLKKNLARNGGYLDEVHFGINTDDEKDVEWIEELVKTEPSYILQSSRGRKPYSEMWKLATDPNTIYVKIDDDIVYVDDNAIPRLVHSLMDNPQAYTVMANLVNSPVAHWLHYHTDAILPYLPDEQAPSETKDWRPSKLPKHPDRNEPWNFDKSITKSLPQGHRWLPLKPTTSNLMSTPIAAGQSYDPFGPALYQWTVAAQQHYSLLEHLESNDLTRYWAGNKEGLWNMQYGRYNLNFIAVRGSSVAARPPVAHDDEEEMTVTIPRELGKPALVDTHAIVSHFSFAPTPVMQTTDLLERYRLYANEKVCSANNQKAKM